MGSRPGICVDGPSIDIIIINIILSLSSSTLLSLSVIPVALDSGYYWPSKILLKKPGIINVVFLNPIKTGLPRSKFMTKLKHDIESCCAELEKKDN